MEEVEEKAPKVPELNQKQQKQVDLEVNAMLEKGSISKVELLSSLVLISKKSEGNRPVKIWKILIGSFPTNTSRWKVCTVWSMCCKKGITCAKETRKLHTSAFLYFKFLWVENLYKLLCFWFRLGPAPTTHRKQKWNVTISLPISLIPSMQIYILMMFIIATVIVLI